RQYVRRPGRARDTARRQPSGWARRQRRAAGPRVFTRREAVLPAPAACHARGRPTFITRPAPPERALVAPLDRRRPFPPDRGPSHDRLSRFSLGTTSVSFAARRPRRGRLRRGTPGPALRRQRGHHVAHPPREAP